jgi:lipopolysaccharide assembly outer membrane protein LptD (OstA)
VKLSLSNCALAFAIVLMLPCAGSSQERLHTFGVGSDRMRITFAADSIIKEDGPTGYASLAHLRGNVEIRTCCVQLPSVTTSLGAYMIMNADEVDYDEVTNKIEAHGVVRVNFQERK